MKMRIDRPKIRVRRTPDALHPYIATMKGKGSYGWGNTPKEARERLKQQLAIPTKAGTTREEVNK